MSKQADVMGSIRDRMGNAGSAMSDWYGALNPETKQTLLRGMAGAAIGGGLTGGIAAATPQDPERRHSIAGPALLGALLGGGAAAGLPLGLKTLGSGVRFDGERSKPALGKVVDRAVVAPAMNHPAMVGLTGWLGLRNGQRATVVWKQFADALRKVKGQTLANAAGKPVGRMGRAATLMTEMATAGHSNFKPHSIRPGQLAIIPAALAGGWLADKYIRGDY